MKLEDLTIKHKPKCGDVVIIKYKNGKKIGIVGEVSDHIARVYDYESRTTLGTVILKYVYKLSTPSKHLRKDLARHLGLECNEDSFSDRYTYDDQDYSKTTKNA